MERSGSPPKDELVRHLLSLCAVAVYLLGVELAGLDVRWMYAPIGDAGSLRDYWLNHGHG